MSLYTSSKTPINLSRQLHQTPHPALLSKRSGGIPRFTRKRRTIFVVKSIWNCQTCLFRDGNPPAVISSKTMKLAPQNTEATITPQHGMFMFMFMLCGVDRRNTCVWRTKPSGCEILTYDTYSGSLRERDRAMLFMCRPMTTLPYRFSLWYLENGMERGCKYIQERKRA